MKQTLWDILWISFELPKDHMEVKRRGMLSGCVELRQLMMRESHLHVAELSSFQPACSL